MDKKKVLFRKDSSMSMVSNADEYIDRFNQMTTRFRLKSLVTDALTLTRQNKSAAIDMQRQDEDKRRKRKARFRLAFRKMPRLCSLMDEVTTPFQRFRRCAIAVMRLIQVCRACKDILAEKVKKESWFTLIDNLVATTEIQQKKRGPRPFVTFVPNEKRELEQLTFDIGEYRRDRMAESCMTDGVRLSLQQAPGTRSPDQIAGVIRAMKGISRDFDNYPLYVQKQLAQVAFYDNFAYNRVIIKKGLTADGYYFVLSGVLIEKVEGRKQPVEIKSGQKFGEDDLICGCKRRHTVLTRTKTELLYIHRIDYKKIFDMSDDSNSPKNLEICKQHIVFQHFPMARLAENPGMWSALRYKYGRLIARDSNDVDWIYVIKSGEARILKYLEPDNIDLKARRRKVASALAAQSSFHKKKQILNFIEDRDYIKSSYRPSSYHPGRRDGAMSAPPTGRRSCVGTHRDFLSLPATPPCRDPIEKTLVNNYTQSVLNQPENKLPQIVVCGGNDSDEGDSKGQDNLENGVEVIDLSDKVRQGRVPKSNGTAKGQDSRRQSRVSLGLGRQMSTCRSQGSGRCSSKGGQITIGKTTLPAFVQVETLHPGQVFGLRACLDAEERGPAVSLVSGECEILQINKKFFMKHCDDAIYGLIRLKAKPFPSEEELVDRLDANLQWEEYKHRTLDEFIKQCRRLDR
ncbi:uncharacterized protein LOC124141859 isoform X1 [Haliotis rufescens]|uniref:uncharacterized protein LOC124141859 isoform X1 n=1 Tax=Haliotis rufescens TaxID=6454 RepID=UPI001EB090CE|nr:uncharacterized protein LOC124141859 isoform X1 [Haliotis rufescens]XP_046365971.1 uncharacterized protein LOC124141859 isoform X1 [Haliotis rufescens]